jgi:hypothetical protein
MSEENPMENEALRDGIGLGLLILLIGAAQLWSAVLGA